MTGRRLLLLLACTAVAVCDDAATSRRLERQIDFDADPGSSDRDNSIYSLDYANLYNFGVRANDEKVNNNNENAGQTIDLRMKFPFYGALYNYTTISINGYAAFADTRSKKMSFDVGPQQVSDWPTRTDPAMIAPYLCVQQRRDSSRSSGVWYRLVLRQDMTSAAENVALRSRRDQFPYLQSSEFGDRFLNRLMFDLQEGVVGASAFRADAALVVTWADTAAATSTNDDSPSATYQMVWMTDRSATLSYVVFNYAHLGFAAADVGSNSRMGRCQALFNGGNGTGLVRVDPSDQFKKDPTSLARTSAVPHVVAGRHLFRVDDVVRRGGCSNKTGGTYPLLIYPNIVNMVGARTVDVNGMCLDPSTTYVLLISERPHGTCQVLNRAIARCRVPMVYDWGTKEVYLQPQGRAESKAFVGFIYFVPPTFDPMRLEIGNLHDWFRKVPDHIKEISWFPSNFTQPSRDGHRDLPYGGALDLLVVGYKEERDDSVKKFIPIHRVIGRIATFNNDAPSSNYDARNWKLQTQQLDLNNLDLNEFVDYEWNDLLSYRFGYLKLSMPVGFDSEESRPGIISPLIPLQWLWYARDGSASREATEERRALVERQSAELCQQWYDEDGSQWNFIRDTETNASCPCKQAQAEHDVGRFMPHPRCSKLFRAVYCTVNLGAANCYVSAQNVYGSYPGYGGGRFATHYGQVCCYDQNGLLMQTSYQPIVKTTEQTPYSPGFPQRAFEFGTEPYQGQFEVPGLSSFYHDIIPYFYCCKWAKNRCQLFYWRRPSSGCQEYVPATPGFVAGAGHFYGLNGDRFTFAKAGIYRLLHIPKTPHNDEVDIQIRLERYPDRTVDFGSHHTPQDRLVQPTNASVVTGIAVQEGNNDRVQVVVRKDTRRHKYRTSVVVGGFLRYFDTMRIQRYRGVLVYMNDVQRAQAEIYIVLEKAKIGLRIRETFARDMDTTTLPESLGLLDVALSLPPDYGVFPDRASFDKYSRPGAPAFEGLEPIKGLLLRRFNQFSQTERPWEVDNTDVSDLEVQRFEADPNAPTRRESIPNLFLSDGSLGDVWPAAALVENRVYAYSSDRHWPIQPKTNADVERHLRDCENKYNFDRPQWDANRNPLVDGALPPTAADDWKCETRQSIVEETCGSFAPCIYDYALLNQKEAAQYLLTSLQDFDKQRLEATRRYNSCGAINVEYPEYMQMENSGSSKYLEGDSAIFNCFQSHWAKGDNDYSCQRRVDRYGELFFQWNKGWQPWCRSRDYENTLSWLWALFLAFIIIMAIFVVFVVCWGVKRKRLREQRGRYNTPYNPYPPIRSKSGVSEKDMMALERPPAIVKLASSETRVAPNPYAAPDKRQPRVISRVGDSTGSERSTPTKATPPPPPLYSTPPDSRRRAASFNHLDTAV